MISNVTSLYSSDSESTGEVVIQRWMHVYEVRMSVDNVISQIYKPIYQVHKYYGQSKQEKYELIQ